MKDTYGEALSVGLGEWMSGDGIGAAGSKVEPKRKRTAVQRADRPGHVHDYHWLAVS